MWNFARQMTRSPPPGLRRLWQRWLLASTGRLLRNAGVERLVCYDIGARWGIWRQFELLPLPICRVGVEPEPEEAERLKKSDAFDAVVPAGLSAEGGTKTLHLARARGSS